MDTFITGVFQSLTLATNAATNNNSATVTHQPAHPTAISANLNPVSAPVVNIQQSSSSSYETTSQISSSSTSAARTTMVRSSESEHHQQMSSRTSEAVVYHLTANTDGPLQSSVVGASTFDGTSSPFISAGTQTEE
ncbi:uncharacterized protein LOC142354529 [Convolutriloba macropyga]|uniref:uncharacterized protein LOC142354529 n=1 Tax=Convolutriloba macropyga TaxID=536237 RepID=UPI003F524464